MTANRPTLLGAHLVGSVSQATAADTFGVVATHLGPAVSRIPDGEVGERFHWMLFQGGAFDRTPVLHRAPIDPIIVAGFDVRPFVLDEAVTAFEIPELGYARAALDSYAAFVRLREAGGIPAGTRFQVSLPTPLAPVTTFIRPADRERVYPAYASALAREIARIIDAVPHTDLAIQFDLATEFAYLEEVNLGSGVPQLWIDGDLTSALVSLAVEAAAAVPDDVDLGFHLCYGDVAEKHFTEPSTTRHLVGVANALVRSLPREVAWIHLPVPIDRTDAAYFAPLADLRIGHTDLHLGLVHHEDGVAGARARIEAAGAFVERFGIATECGFGRGPRERTAPLLDLHAEILEEYGTLAIPTGGRVRAE